MLDAQEIARAQRVEDELQRIERREQGAHRDRDGDPEPPLASAAERRHGESLAQPPGVDEPGRQGTPAQSICLRRTVGMS